MIDDDPPGVELDGGAYCDVRGDYLPALEAAAAAGRPVVYAIEQDDLGSRVVQDLVRRRIRYLPAQRTRPTSYAYKDAAARRAIEAEYERQTREGWAKFEPGSRDAENICQVLRLTEAVPGAYVEIGCYLGSSGAVAMRYMAERDIRRPAWFFDVFEGFNYPAAQESADAVWAGTHATDGLEKVAERLSLHARPDLGRPVHVRRANVITDPFPEELGPIAAANIDVDMFEAVLIALERVAPLMAPGGIIIAEDPGHTPLLIGAQAALDMFLQRPEAEPFTPIYMESGQYLLMRRR